MFMFVSVSVWRIFTEFDKVRKAFLPPVQTTKLHGQSASLPETPYQPTAVEYSYRQLPRSLRFSIHLLTSYLFHPPILRGK